MKSYNFIIKAAGKRFGKDCAFKTILFLEIFVTNFKHYLVYRSPKIVNFIFPNHCDSNEFYIFIA